MNISLVVPDFLSGTSFLQQPLDFLYIAHFLDTQGHNVNIVDCRVRHYSFVTMFDYLQESDLIVVTTTPSDQVQNYYLDFRYAYSVLTINNIKSKFPNTLLVVCGAHATVRPDLVFKEVKADILIIGEIFGTLSILVSVLSSSKNYNLVPNIAYRVDETYIFTESDEFVKHPAIPNDIIPAYDKVEMSKYFGVQYKHNIPLRKLNRAVVQGGRGCPFSCKFCHNFYGSRIQRRSPECILTELSICQNQYGVKEIFFLDEVFTLDKDWVISLCELIQRYKIHLELTIQTRADLLDKELLSSMYKAGVKNIWIGVESASNEILNISSKNLDVETILYAIEIIRSNNIEPHAFFMLGMPGESVGTLNTTIRRIYEYKLPYTRSIMICTPRYGTEYYKLALKQYPDIQKHWFSLNAIKGLVANEMTPTILQKAKTLLKKRDFVYANECPQI